MARSSAQEIGNEGVGRDGQARPSSPSVPTAGRDEELIIASLAAAVPSIAAITGRECEVVVHDLRCPERSIVAIANGHVSGRQIGSPLIGGPMNDVALKALARGVNPNPEILAYQTKTSDGRVLKSTTTLYYNLDCAPFAALCLNHDLSVPLAAARWLDQLVGATGAVAEPASEPGHPSRDFGLVLDELIAECLGREPGPVSELDREARLRIVAELEGRGAFLLRGSVVRVADALGISKFTVYSYLDEVRSSG